MSAFFPFELEPPPWLYRLLARLPLMQRFYRRVAADLAATAPDQALLLDIGAGPGRLLTYVGTRRPDLSLVALDRSLAMLRRPRPLPTAAPARQLARVVGDAAALPLRSACCDLALATFSFHTWDQPVRGLQEMARVLKPGGRVWIYEMNREATWGQLAALAREEALPVPLVAAGFKMLSWNHALRAREFDATFTQAGLSPWHLETVHQVFWRAVFQAGQPAAHDS